MSIAAPASAPNSPAPAPSQKRRAARASRPGWVLLEDVPYDLYVRLRDLEANNHHRMVYHNGTLEIMPPGYRHEWNAEQIGLVVRTVCITLGIPCGGSGSTTFRVGELKKTRGAGAEADKGFYLNNEPAVRGKAHLQIGIDPPPDLWIEVDDSNRTNSRKRKVLATLGVPEIWRLSAQRRVVRFYRLVDGHYVSVQRSACLPMLTPALVDEALGRADGRDESTWGRELQQWALPLPRP